MLTQVGAVMGTLGYMAPEQVRGRPADARSDQFSFCVALWEALYGERPFKGSTDLAIYRAEVLAGRIRTPSRDDVPAWLRTVLERGLAVDPLERWASMDELLDALTRDPTSGRRRRVVAAVSLGLIGVTMGALVAANREAEADRLERCEARGRAIEDTWNPEIAARLERAFASTDTPVAASAWTATHLWLDRYAVQLGVMRRELSRQRRSRARAARRARRWSRPASTTVRPTSRR